MRRALRGYLASGDRAEARRALGAYARSSGGGRAGTQRVARAARIAGAAFGGLASARAGQPPADNALDLRTLTGQPVDAAIAAIVDAFCPPGILDEEVIRAAMAEALAEALDGLDTFDPSAVSDAAIVIALRSFIAELVFSAIMAEQGQTAQRVPPDQAVARENDFREIVRELTDSVATPIIQAAGGALGGTQIEALVRRITGDVHAEAATWE